MSMRVGGIASGLDTHGLIEQLLQLERRPILTLQAKAKDLQTRQTAWQDIGKRLGNLDTVLAKLSVPSAYSAMKAVSSSESLTASVGNNASLGSWHVQIERLAEARVIASTSFSSVGPGEFSINGTTVSLTEASDIRGVAAAINGAGKSAYDFQVQSEGEILVSGTYRGAEDATLVAEVQGSDLLIYKNGELAQTFSDVLDQSGAGSIVFDGISIALAQVESGDSVEIQARSAKQTGVTASVVDGRLILTAATHKPLEFSDPQGILEQIGILDDQGNEQHVLVEGATALLRVNGLLVERESNTIDDVLDGVSLVLNEAGEKLISLSVERDNQAITDSLQEFVNLYNSLRSVLGNQNVMKGDTMAVRLQNSLWSAVTAATSGEGIRTLMDLGITGVGRTGQFQLNPEKLEAALADPDSVRELLVGEGGLIKEIRSVLEQWSDSKGLIKTRLDTYKTQIRSNETSIRRAQDRVERKEAQLWRQYTAMEKALSSLFNQGNWLAGQLSNLPGYTRSKG